MCLKKMFLKKSMRSCSTQTIKLIKVDGSKNLAYYSSCNVCSTTFCISSTVF